MSYLGAVILAAGEGTRMKSALPKVLHKLWGKTMLEHVLAAVNPLTGNIIIVTGHGSDEVKEQTGAGAGEFVLQEIRLGTGDAVKRVTGSLPASGRLLVLCGDAPLLKTESINKLAAIGDDTAAAVLTVRVPDPAGYGRIIRNEQDEVAAIVEEAGASAEEKLISEVNTGAWCFSIEALLKYLPMLRPDPVKGEYYLTDVPEMLVKDGYRVKAVMAEDYREGLGINDFYQLSRARKIMQERINRELMDNGVDIVDPDTTYIDTGVRVGKGTVLYPRCTLEGSTTVGEDCRVGPETQLIDTVMEAGVKCRYTVAEEALIRQGALVGPYSYLRPGTEVGREVKIGDFVEVKNSVIGDGTKIPHLSYIGDCDIGAGANFGAGSIVVNYDGKKKYRTKVGSKAFIGCNSNLISPLEIGDGAYVAAGSTLTKDVPGDALALGRSPQVNKPGLARRLLKKQ